MSGEETLKSVNLNSYLSVSLLIVIVTAALWINNSINDVKTNQIRQESNQNSANATMQIKVDTMSSRIDAMGARIDGLVTRPELEAKVSELRLENSKLELQLLKSQVGGEHGNSKFVRP